MDGLAPAIPVGQAMRGIGSADAVRRALASGGDCGWKRREAMPHFYVYTPGFLGGVRTLS